MSEQPHNQRPPGGIFSVRTLHDAAQQLEGVYVTVEHILDEANLLERANYLAVADAGAIVEGLTDSETAAEIERQSGMAAYVDVVWRLRDLLATVEQNRLEAHIGWAA